MIRMSKHLNRGVDYKVRNRAADKEFVNSGAHERIIITISTSSGKNSVRPYDEPAKYRLCYAANSKQSKQKRQTV